MPYVGTCNKARENSDPLRCVGHCRVKGLNWVDNNIIVYLCFMYY